MNSTEGLDEEAHVVVVGGGPGGSTLATLIAMRGHRVVLLEKEKFPRWQIGESLLPSTVHGICRLTGVADELAKAGFTRKRGGTMRWGANPEPWTFSFSVSPRIASETSHAYQVERSRFDQILLDHARHTGVDVREQHAVVDVVESDGRVGGVTYADAEGARGTIRARYVVDASGNRSRIHQHVGAAREYSEFFRSLALFGYFEGGKRLPEPNSGNILCAAFESGWFWYIPLSPTLTSVGAVVRRELADRVQGDPEAALTSLVAECPLIGEYLRDATRVTEGPYGELRVRKDYSYANTRFWRPGMALVGDAACFIDPIFSSGVHLATYGALLAARSINSVLDGTVEEDTAFREFEERYRREYRAFHDFLVSFYNMHVDEASYFWSAKKVTESTGSDLQSFVSLVGGVSSGEATLATQQALVQRYTSQSGEFAAAVDELAGSTEPSILPLMRASVVKDAMQEGANEQIRAQLGSDVGPEIPLLDGGLIASPDGLSWSSPA
ncbi:tryptophan 7-halogenase [Streptomyces sp. NPDC058464]|uniref:tryptophan 7-halogenase n=1 Tax=Streptomyces sp. NPDC058464 TaxID=3346511 RepID=UPI0036582480